MPLTSFLTTFSFLILSTFPPAFSIFSWAFLDIFKFSITNFLLILPSERILTGEFDVVSLVDSKDILIETAKDLEESNISYYLELMNSDNESQTVAAYYKTMEYCFKEMRKILE